MTCSTITWVLHLTYLITTEILSANCFSFPGTMYNFKVIIAGFMLLSIHLVLALTISDRHCRLVAITSHSGETIKERPRCILAGTVVSCILRCVLTPADVPGNSSQEAHALIDHSLF